MYSPGIWELLIILVIVLIVFGAGKLKDVGKSLGEGIREFKDSVKNPDDEVPNPNHNGNSGTAE